MTGIQKNKIDWNQVRALFAAGVRTDFRGHRTGSKWSPLVQTFIVYTVMGASMAAGIVQTASTFVYSVLVFGYSMLMMVLAVLYEFSAGPEDMDVLSFRPVSGNTILAAKSANLLFFTLLMGSGLCLIPAFMGLVLPHASGSFPFFFVLLAGVANLFAGFLVSGMYPLIEERLSAERFKDALVYVQVGATFIIFLGLQLFNRLAVLSPYPNAEVAPVWFRFLPPVWFASGMSLVSDMNSRTDFCLFLLGLASTAVLGGMAFRSLAYRYQKEDESLSTKGKEECGAAKSYATALLGSMLKHPETKAGYTLVFNLMRRDRSVKMNVYPLLGIPIAFLVLHLLEKKVSDPFGGIAQHITGSSGTALIYIVFFMIITLISGLLYSRDWESAWIFHASPVRSPGKLFWGLQLYLLERILLPYFLLFFVLFCTRMPWVHAAQYTLTLFLFCMIALAVALLFIRDFPFSKKMEKGRRSRSLVFLFAAIPFLAVFMWATRFLAHDKPVWGVFQIALFALFLVLQKLTEIKLTHRLKQKEFSP